MKAGRKPREDVDRYPSCRTCLHYVEPNHGFYEGCRLHQTMAVIARDARGYCKPYAKNWQPHVQRWPNWWSKLIGLGERNDDGSPCAHCKHSRLVSEQYGHRFCTLFDVPTWHSLDDEARCGSNRRLFSPIEKNVEPA